MENENNLKSSRGCLRKVSRYSNIDRDSANEKSVKLLFIHYFFKREDKLNSKLKVIKRKRKINIDSLFLKVYLFSS